MELLPSLYLSNVVHQRTQRLKQTNLFPDLHHCYAFHSYDTESKAPSFPSQNFKLRRFDPCPFIKAPGTNIISPEKSLTQRTQYDDHDPTNHTSNYTKPRNKIYPDQDTRGFAGGGS
jgi:hypothetical protein